MKRYGVLIVGIMTLSLALTGSWASAAEKTGFVNIREVMITSNAGKKEIDDIKKSIDKTKAIINERELELSKLKDELEKQKPLLKEEVLKEKELAFQKKLRDYQILVKDSNQDLQVKDEEISKKLYPEILKVVQAIGEREKYSMIVDIGQIPVPVPIAYYAKENDLTKRVVEEFNKTYKPKK
jgi:outer membrane protein